jgi:aspartyl-tRNA(Asn)/glutamyl-tRNA(Gln) amidotransferase subunit B
MEEDAGKLLHDPHRPLSRVDLNRTGVPLIEIVSEPDIRSPEAAGAYLRQLHTIVRYLGICDGNMEEGSFRCDANISVRPAGSDEFGTRTEIKNLNSFRHVEKALHYEIRRQVDRLAEGDRVVQETRLWDPEHNRTHSMRGKEEAHDYRYFPDPDLLPLVIDDAWIERARGELPELPDAKRRRFQKEFGLPETDAAQLSASRELAEYFESCLQVFPNPKAVCNWIMGSLMARLNAESLGIENAPVTPENLGRLLELVERGVISGKIAKTVFEEMAASGRPPGEIVAEKGLEQVTDHDAIDKVVREVLDANPRQVEQYREGKPKLLGFFVGQVMKATRGKANPKLVNDILKARLKTE